MTSPIKDSLRADEPSMHTELEGLVPNEINARGTREGFHSYCKKRGEWLWIISTSLYQGWFSHPIKINFIWASLSALATVLPLKNLGEQSAACMEADFSQVSWMNNLQHSPNIAGTHHFPQIGFEYWDPKTRDPGLKKLQKLSWTGGEREKRCLQWHLGWPRTRYLDVRVN